VELETQYEATDSEYWVFQGRIINQRVLNLKMKGGTMKRIRRKLFGAILVIGVTLTITSVSAGSQVIILGHPSHEDIRLPGMGMVAAIHSMKHYIETTSEGDLTLDVHPRGQLGSPRAMMEQCQAGIIQMFYAYTAIMIPFCPEMALVETPYLFRDSLSGIRAMQGPLGKELADLYLKKTGLRVLSWPEATGARDLFTTDKLVKTQADLQGMRIRVPENPGIRAFYVALGAKPVTVTLSEMYTALQTGVCEGVDFVLAGTEEFKLFEVVRNVTMFHAMWEVHAPLINEKFFRSLSLKNQMIIMHAAKLAEMVHNGFNKPAELMTIDRAMKGGAKFYYPTAEQSERFKKIGQKAYLDGIAGSVGKEWIDKFFSSAAKAAAEIDSEYRSEIQK
jgi:TRAP-type C4-dicarboxylate transport system substrate-binding protein